MKRKKILAQKTHMQAGLAQLWHFHNNLKTIQHREGQYPKTGMPHRSPTGAKASGHTVEVCSKACREVEVGSRVRRKEALVGRDGKMVRRHQIESSSA